MLLGRSLSIFGFLFFTCGFVHAFNVFSMGTNSLGNTDPYWFMSTTLSLTAGSMTFKNAIIYAFWTDVNHMTTPFSSHKNPPQSYIVLQPQE